MKKLYKNLLEDCFRVSEGILWFHVIWLNSLKWYLVICILWGTVVLETVILTFILFVCVPFFLQQSAVHFMIKI